MPTKELPSDLPVVYFQSAGEFEAFLEREHATAPGFHLKLAKKSSGIPSVSSAEAIEVALCFGWIDGKANGLDDQWWLVRYTPRRSKSIWSQKNVNTVARLIEEGRMRPSGMASVEAAKVDGRWERAYAGPATITTPADFTTALSANPAAASFFETLNKSDRYAVLWRIETASPKSRFKRIETLTAMLANGQRPGDTAKSTAPPSNSNKKGAIVKKRRSVGSTNKKKSASENRSAKTAARSSPPQQIQERHPRRAGLRRRS